MPRPLSDKEELEFQAQQRMEAARPSTTPPSTADRFGAGFKNAASLDTQDDPNEQGWSGTAGRVAGSFVPPLAGAAVGSLFGPFGALVGGVTGAAAQGVGRQVDEQMDRGVPFGKVNWTGPAIGGAGEGILQALPLFKGANIAGTVAKNALAQGAVSGATTAGSELATTGHIDPGQVGLSALTGAGGGAAGGLLKGVLSKNAFRDPILEGHLTPYDEAFPANPPTPNTAKLPPLGVMTAGQWADNPLYQQYQSALLNYANLRHWLPNSKFYNDAREELTQTFGAMDPDAAADNYLRNFATDAERNFVQSYNPGLSEQIDNLIMQSSPQGHPVARGQVEYNAGLDEGPDLSQWLLDKNSQLDMLGTQIERERAAGYQPSGNEVATPYADRMQAAEQQAVADMQASIQRDQQQLLLPSQAGGPYGYQPNFTMGKDSINAARIQGQQQLAQEVSGMLNIIRTPGAVTDANDMRRILMTLQQKVGFMHPDDPLRREVDGLSRQYGITPPK